MKEKNDLEELILDIENTPPQKIETRSQTETFQLRNDPLLTTDLSGGAGTYFVRTILHHMKLDEHHLTKWRLENKYRQYQILNYYAAGCMAKTLSFSQLLQKDNGPQIIRNLCEDGYFVKSTLGDSSGRDDHFDRTEDLEDIINTVQQENDSLDKWVLQKKLNLKNEFRIHSFGRDIIYGLTFIINGPNSSNSSGPEHYLKSVLEKLPETLLIGTLIGWDIATSKTNKHYVIEANITGFHPDYGRGFQTSGYFGDFNYGSVMCAWFNNYMHYKYGISVNAIENFMLFHYPFYSEFLFYASIFTKEHIEVFCNKVKNAETSIIIYLDGDINNPFIKILKFFQMEKFGKKYYLLVSEKHFTDVNDHFQINELTEVLNDHTLFSDDEYIHVKKLEYQKRKRICCDQLLDSIKEKNYIIL